MHYLKACGIDYISEGFNPKSRYAYFVFERTEKLKHALEGWDNFKEKHLYGS